MTTYQNGGNDPPAQQSPEQIQKNTTIDPIMSDKMSEKSSQTLGSDKECFNASPRNDDTTIPPPARAVSLGQEGGSTDLTKHQLPKVNSDKSRKGPRQEGGVVATAPQSQEANLSESNLNRPPDGDTTEDDDYDSENDDVEDDFELTCRETLPSSPMESIADTDRDTLHDDMRRVDFVNREVTESSSVLKKSIGRPPLPPSTTRKRQRPQLPTASSRKVVIPRGKRIRESPTSDDDNNDDDNEPPPSAPRGVSRKESNDAQELMKSSTNLEYSWESLRLGDELGSAALNRYLERHHPTGNAPTLSAKQMPQIIKSLRVKTIMPPMDSDLHRVVQKNRFENQTELYGPDNTINNDEEEEDDPILCNPTAVNKPIPYLLEMVVDPDEAPECSMEATRIPKPLSPRPPESLRIPFKTLARLYESMCEQDVDDGTANRRETQYLSATACVERLQSLENQICATRLKEQSVVQQGNELGLWNMETVCSLLGYRNPVDEDGIANTEAKEPL